MSRFKRYFSSTGPEVKKCPDEHGRTIETTFHPSGSTTTPLTLIQEGESTPIATAHVVIDSQDKVWGVSGSVWGYLVENVPCAAKGVSLEEKEKALADALLAHNRLPPNQRLDIEPGCQHAAGAKLVGILASITKQPTSGDRVPIIASRLAEALNQREAKRYE